MEGITVNLPHPSTLFPLLCCPRYHSISSLLCLSSLSAGQEEPERPHAGQEPAAVLHMPGSENGKPSDDRDGQGIKGIQITNEGVKLYLQMV